MNMTMDAPVPELRRTRRICAAAAFASLGSLWAALLVAAPEDVASQAALQGYLDRAGGRMFVAWILVVLSGSAWLCLVVGLRRMLPAGAGRDLFVVAAVSGQAAAWVGARWLQPPRHRTRPVFRSRCSTRSLKGHTSPRRPASPPLG